MPATAPIAPRPSPFPSSSPTGLSGSGSDDNR
jgi:hypothetical protein